jgi:peptide chain release factor 2
MNLAKEEGDTVVVNESVKAIFAAEQELRRLELNQMLSGELDRNAAILQVNAGSGGTEACDWAGMLARMYGRWAEKKGFTVQMLDHLPGDGAGIKSVSMSIEGPYAYGYLRSENGVHRLVRISPYDANARRHTSFASVSVSPQIDDDIEVDIKDADLKVDTFKSGGAGGQHVNKTESAVRITHLPTGIIVACQMERSQHKNRAMAMKMLKAKLYSIELEKRKGAQQAIEDSKADSSWGNQIRSYVLQPYQLIKDHRTDYEVGKVNDVLDGELDGFMEAYLMSQQQAEQGKRS